MIIVGSTRPERVGIHVAEWVRDRAEEHGSFELDFADLREIDLPLLDEPKHPSRGEYEHEHTRYWGRRVDAADAFVLVHPEYNHGMNAALKNAIDYLNREWKRKPLALVSYGGVSAGTRAAGQLQQVAGALGMVVAATVPIPFVSQFTDEAGGFTPNEWRRRPRRCSTSSSASRRRCGRCAKRRSSASEAGVTLATRPRPRPARATPPPAGRPP